MRDSIHVQFENNEVMSSPVGLDGRKVSRLLKSVLVRIAEQAIKLYLAALIREKKYAEF